MYIFVKAIEKRDGMGVVLNCYICMSFESSSRSSKASMRLCGTICSRNGLERAPVGVPGEMCCAGERSARVVRWNAMEVDCARWWWGDCWYWVAAEERGEPKVETGGDESRAGQRDVDGGLRLWFCCCNSVLHVKQNTRSDVQS